MIALVGVILRIINAARRALYRRHVLKAQQLPRPVISIGNIAAGGAGKTPAVIAVARFLKARGLKVAVLTRGYGRSDDRQGIVTTIDADLFGDEPVLIKQSADVDVIVGKNRYENATRYLEAIDCFILDDGFQHLQLHRDLDIVIDVNGARLYREGRSALRDADIVVPRRIELAIPEHLKGKRVFAFSALADNNQFFESLAKAGLAVVGTRGFPDHHRYSAADLNAIDAAAAKADAIVTTEKDAVKIPRRDIIAVPAEFVFEPQVLEQIYAEAKKPRSADR